ELQNRRTRSRTCLHSLVGNFQHPEKCVAASCTGDDLLKNADAVKGEGVFADSILASKDGKMDFAAYLATGNIPKGWFGNGLTNPLGAQVQIVSNDHGLVIPAMADSMVNTYRGGCTDKSLPRHG